MGGHADGDAVPFVKRKNTSASSYLGRRVFPYLDMWLWLGCIIQPSYVSFYNSFHWTDKLPPGCIYPLWMPYYLQSHIITNSVFATETATVSHESEIHLNNLFFSHIRFESQLLKIFHNILIKGNFPFFLFMNFPIFSSLWHTHTHITLYAISRSYTSCSCSIQWNYNAWLDVLMVGYSVWRVREGALHSAARL